MKIVRLLSLSGAILCLLATAGRMRADEPAPDFATQIAPLLTKYCAGCHTEEDGEGDLSLESYAGLLKGGQTGPVITAGSAKSSRLIGVLTGRVEPAMPPEDEEAPTDKEIALLAAWIEAGAPGPSGAEPARRLIAPKLPPVDAPAAVTAVAFSPEGTSLAVARFATVELRASPSTLKEASSGQARSNQHPTLERAEKPVDADPSQRQWLEHPGKVESVRYSKDGQFLIAATGVTGLYGEARLWNTLDGTLQKTFPDDQRAVHRDILYAAVPSPDGRLLATAGYDRTIVLWDIETGKLVRKLQGHNGAVFDLAFSPDGKLLASASADTTVKIWHVASGRRLDTRSEPLKELYTVAVSPDGRLLVAGGADSRLRVWRLVSTDKPHINPLLYARFAHEGAIHVLRFSDDGRYLVSAGADGEVKLWETKTFRQIHSWPHQPASVQALAISSAAGRVAVGRMDGSVEFYPLPSREDLPSAARQKQRQPARVPTPATVASEYAESEPNNSPEQALAVTAPARIKGVIDSQQENAPHEADSDWVRFSSLANQTWIIEVRAARDQSPLDSHVEVVDAQGKSIPRVVLQAVRDSYFTFRGKDSDQTNDFRLFNWEEMRLNQYLYCEGEVVRLYHYPRGPDSGFNVYPNFGKRHGFFDTTPIAHALNEPCYVVEPFPPSAKLLPNGLPTFVIHYENDDQSQRELGNDSYLTFTAPSDGEYLVRVRDVRGLEGGDFRYELAIRAPEPDFKIRSVLRNNENMLIGAGRKFGVELDRSDGFDGPVTIHVEGLPPGFSTHTPLVVQAGQLRAWGTIFVDSAVPALAEKNAPAIRLTAVAEIDGREVRKWAHDFGKIVLQPEGKLRVKLAPSSPDAPTKEGLPVVEITPGATAKVVVQVERNGYEGRISFGKEEALFNAPHGVYVDNIGLNGVQIQEKENQRTVFLTAEPWVEPQERVVFLEAAEQGQPTSNPVLLRVVRPQTDAKETLLSKAGS